jgi:hypothetical protein
VTQPGTTEHKKLPSSLKVALLIVAAAFLAYSIYWLVKGAIWGYTVTYMLLHINQISILRAMGSTELAALFIQEYCSAANSFVLMFCGVFATQSAVFYVKNNQGYLRKLRWTLVLFAVFSLLLLPASLHHLIGVTFGWTMVDLYVGLSYLVQTLLIVPPLLILTQKMRKPLNTTEIIKWGAIAAPLISFGLWFKYLFLWADALVPLGPKEASVATIVGAANSSITLLVAGAVLAWGCYGVIKKKSRGEKLVGTGIVLLGMFFVVFSVVAVFVPVYASFWYLTDTWMLSLPVLGAAVLALGKRE